MTYTLYTNGVLEKDDFNVPIDEFNQDYIDYLAWRELGNVPESADAGIYLAKLEQQTLDKKQFKDEYQTAINTLQSHIDETAWTNAKIINAVVFQSRVLLYIIRILRRLV